MLCVFALQFFAENVPRSYKVRAEDIFVDTCLLNFRVQTFVLRFVPLFFFLFPPPLRIPLPVPIPVLEWWCPFSLSLSLSSLFPSLLLFLSFLLSSFLAAGSGSFSLCAPLCLQDHGLLHLLRVGAFVLPPPTLSLSLSLFCLGRSPPSLAPLSLSLSSSLSFLFFPLASFSPLPLPILLWPLLCLSFSLVLLFPLPLISGANVSACLYMVVGGMLSVFFAD